MRSGILASILCLLAFCAGRPAAAGSNLSVVPEVDLERYAGLWYEIARLPNRFQEVCAGDATARYTLLDNGTIEVVNRCRNQEGGYEEVKGIAKLADPDGPASKLKVSFAPSFLSFVFWLWGDYWIIELAPDYSYAVVGEPERKYLWILSRSPQMERETLVAIARRAARQGFDVRKLILTRHTTAPQSP